MYRIRDVIIYFSYKYKGNWDDIYKAIETKERVDEEKVNEAIRKIGDNTICIIDEDYPSTLKNIYRPPFVLYYKGDKSLLCKDSKYVAFIGSRNPSKYGVESTKKLINDLFEEDIIIVSGLAKGIDGVAHQAALDNYLKTIAIMGTGIDVCYPKENLELYDRISKEGLILSEYPLSCCESDSFPRRNRIIAGLVEDVVITDAKMRSGTSITVNYALEQGKDVYCVPTSIFEDSLCNKLLKDGAWIITNGKELLEKK